MWYETGELCSRHCAAKTSSDLKLFWWSALEDAFIYVLIIHLQSAYSKYPQIYIASTLCKGLPITNTVSKWNFHLTHSDAIKTLREKYVSGKARRPLLMKCAGWTIKPLHLTWDNWGWCYNSFNGLFKRVQIWWAEGWNYMVQMHIINLEVS